MEDQDSLRLTGIVSIIAALLCTVADLFLLGLPISGKEITLEAMAMIPHWRLVVGSTLGIVVIPFWLLGLWPVYAALKPAGTWFSIPVVVLLGYSFVVSTAFHGAYAFYGAGFQAQAVATGEAQTILKEMMDRFMDYRTAFTYVTVPALFIGSIWFIATVLSGRTLYSRWMAIFVPPIGSLPFLLFRLLPAPIGGYVATSMPSMGYVIFFVFATVVTWKTVEDTT